jgi:hypothetical protein
LPWTLTRCMLPPKLTRVPHGNAGMCARRGTCSARRRSCSSCCRIPTSASGWKRSPHWLKHHRRRSRYASIPIESVSSGGGVERSQALSPANTHPCTWACSELRWSDSPETHCVWPVGEFAGCRRCHGAVPRSGAESFPVARGAAAARSHGQRDGKSSLGDVKSSLGDAKSSLGEG